MADETLAHVILRDPLERLDGDATVFRWRDALVRAIEKKLKPDTPEFAKALNAVRDDLVARICKTDEEL